MKRILIATTLLLPGVGNVDAAPRLPLKWCNGCTDAYKKNTAESMGLGHVLVGDLNVESLQAFNVANQKIGEDEAGHPIYRKVASPIGLTSPYIEAGETLFDFHATPVAGWRKDRVVDYPDPNVNVYDVVNSGPDQNRVIAWLPAQYTIINANLTQRLNELGEVVQILDASAWPKVDVIVKFKDESQIRFSIDYSTDNPAYKEVKDSGIDDHMNTVLNEKRNTPVQFDLRGATDAEARQWAQQMTWLGYLGASTVRATWACTKSAAGYVCEVYSK